MPDLLLKGFSSRDGVCALSTSMGGTWKAWAAIATEAGADTPLHLESGHWGVHSFSEV